MDITVFNITLYSLGLILNIVGLWFGFRRWKKLTTTTKNNKLLLATPVILSLGIIFTNLAFKWIPRGTFVCYHLPGFTIFILCFVISCFTCLVCVRYAQITSKWLLRRSFIMWLVFAVFVVSALFSMPIFFFHVKKWPILAFGECRIIATDAKDVELAHEFNSKVVHYAFWFVVQFVIHFFIFGSRVVLMLIHLWLQPEDTLPKHEMPVAIRFTVNAAFAIAFVVVIMVLSLCTFNMEHEEAINLLNEVFHKLTFLLVFVFCLPWYNVEMVYFLANKDGEDSGLVKENEKQFDI